jgi:hypothetical protein
MRFDDRLDQTQSQTEAALRATLIAAIQAGPDARLFIRGNSHAVVAELHQYARIL